MLLDSTREAVYDRREVHRPRETHFSTTNCSNFHEWEAASPEILLARIIRVHSGYSWFKDIRAG
jgi:hypothetical protein